MVGNVLAPPYANKIVPKAKAKVDTDVGLECLASSETSGICNNTVTKSSIQPPRAVSAAHIAIHLLQKKPQLELVRINHRKCAFCQVCWVI